MLQPEVRYRRHSGKSTRSRVEGEKSILSRRCRGGPVDVTSAPSATPRTYSGVADRSALLHQDPRQCARNNSSSVLVLMSLPDLDGSAAHYPLVFGGGRSPSLPFQLAEVDAAACFR